MSLKSTILVLSSAFMLMSAVSSNVIAMDPEHTKVAKKHREEALKIEAKADKLAADPKKGKKAGETYCEASHHAGKAGAYSKSDEDKALFHKLDGLCKKFEEMHKK